MTEAQHFNRRKSAVDRTKKKDMPKSSGMHAPRVEIFIQFMKQGVTFCSLPSAPGGSS